MKYFNFKTKTLDCGTVVPYYKGISFSSSSLEDIPAGIYTIDTELYPSYFEMKDGQKCTVIFEGFANYPLFKFDITLYNNGQDPFIPFDYNSADHFKHQIRRDAISKEITYQVLYPTELKYHRSAILAMKNALAAMLTRLGYNDILNNLNIDSGIVGFESLNTTINRIIDDHEKSEAYFSAQIEPKVYTGKLGA